MVPSVNGAGPPTSCKAGGVPARARIATSRRATARGVPAESGRGGDGVWLLYRNGLRRSRPPVA